MAAVYNAHVETIGGGGGGLGAGKYGGRQQHQFVGYCQRNIVKLRM